MITILTHDSYLRFLAHIDGGSQPAFIGEIRWPGSTEPEAAFIKLYQSESCGTVNEAIGYAINAMHGVPQPAKGAILLLQRRQLPQLNIAIKDFIDAGSELAVCWACSYESAQPIAHLRRLSSFSEKQLTAFYCSRFCQLLAVIDHVTGNDDRNEGNFLYRDDNHYSAIDQGRIGGGLYWHRMYPSAMARNQLIQLAHENLKTSQWNKWATDAIMLHEDKSRLWPDILSRLTPHLTGLLKPDEIDMITEYMSSRASGLSFAKSCERLC